MSLVLVLFVCHACCWSFVFCARCMSPTSCSFFPFHLLSGAVSGNHTMTGLRTISAVRHRYHRRCCGRLRLFPAYP